MIEVIKEYQVFKGVKIIIAIRDNLYQLVFSGTKHKGGQREKFKPLYIEMEWTKEDLQLLLEKRLEIITQKNLSIQSVFDKLNNGRQNTGFDYIIERTFLRPRDIISFINHIIENANNKSYFTLDIIKKAEISYSIDRLQAIEDEWGENYGDLKEIFKFLEGRMNGFRLKSIKEDEFANVLCVEEPHKLFSGDLLNLIVKWNKTEIKFSFFIKEVLYLLYKFGIIGIKKSANYPVHFYYQKYELISVLDINNDCRLYVHPMFYSALKINIKALESEEY